jgi:TatD DNase family protein
MIDTHAHIYLPQFDEDRVIILKNAKAVGVTDILMPAINFDSADQMRSISDTPLRLHEMAGIHPCDVKEELDEARLWNWCAEKSVCAIGESGLDYYWSTDFVEEQKRSLRFHCRLARDLNKPIVLHNRESTADMLKIINEEQDGRLRGVWHCFNGTVDEGKEAIDLGFLLGIGGVVTFRNGGVDKTVSELPLSSMILETDSPYLAPAPHRGKRNEPSYTQLVAIKLSEIFQLSLSEIDAITTQNALRLFELIREA